MKARKRFLSVLLSLCLVLGMLPGAALAAGSNGPFTDVNPTDWYYDAVQYVSSKGIMGSAGNATFAPNATTTRGMIVTALYRMEGGPSAASASFTDVPAGQWYSDAVAWASAGGIVDGYGNGAFGPNDVITREQMATILYRYSQHKGYDTSAAGSLAGFADASQVSSYAAASMSWAIGSGLISGVGNNMLAPKGNATRAQVATILMRFCESVPSANAPGAAATPDQTTYTVTFYLNYGDNDQYDVQTVKAGEKVTRPTNPVRSGYTFGGWYTGQTGGSQFNFKNGVTSNLSLYAHWNTPVSGGNVTGTGSLGEGNGNVGGWPYPGGGIGGIGGGSTAPVEGFVLRADKSIVIIGDDDGKVHLYLETNLTADSINVQYGAGAFNNSVTLYDNGVEPDDIAGDGVYSAKITLNVTEDTALSFVANYGSITSNVVNIMYYASISAETYEAMETVDQKIEDILAQPGFMGKTDAEKIEIIQDTLQPLVESKMIQDGSIQVLEEIKLVSFLYPQGILGGIMYGEFESEKDSLAGVAILNDDALSDGDSAAADNDGVDGSGVPGDAEAADGNDIGDDADVADVTDAGDVADVNDVEAGEEDPDGNDVVADDPADVDDPATDVPERVEAPDSYEVFDDFSENVPMLFAVTDDGQAEELGTAVILNSFPAFETEQYWINYRTQFYNTLKSNWDNSGLATTIVSNPTVSDYKNIDDYNVICISTHGSRYGWYDNSGYHEYSTICLAEKQTYAKNEAYEVELQSHQIAKVNGCYWIMPSFFTNQYNEDAFADSFVFVQCCMSMGTGAGANASNYDYSMANAFIGRSAKASIGYHNSVFSDYGREFMEQYVNNLIDGKTSQESFEGAVSVMGANHEVWFNNHFPSTLQYYYEHEKDPTETYQPLVHIAYPVHNGDGNAVLVNSGLQNGGFEKFSQITTTPHFWECLGDVRTMGQLGTVVPYGSESKRMAIVTTGIGSQSSASFEGGTEGSKLSQTFKVPEGASKIVFDYNFISEEPMEYVNTQYNDTFVVQASQGGTVFYDHTYESINTSEWIPVGGIDFVGGDHTTFQTGWKKGEIDVSAYAGKIITLSFIIYDVGDEIFDSACVIDNVMVQ